MQQQNDCGIEQILARAILDLELKMKHEMRQNSALQLAKIEKHSQQMEKRLGIVEAKLEALLSRDNNSSGGGMGGPPNSHYRGGGNRLYSAAGTGSVNRQTSYYSRTTNLANGHHQFDKQQQIPRTTTPVSRTPHQHYGPMFGSQTNTPPQHRVYAPGTGRGGIERKQQRPKQTVGTGANKTQIVKQPQQEKPPLIEKNATWTTKLGGVYTSGEDSDEETKTRSGSESCYSVAKPAPKCGEIVSADEEEKSNKQYSDEEEEDEVIIDDEEKKENAKEGLIDEMMMVLEEETTKTTKTAISNSNCTFKSSLEEEIVFVEGKKKKVDDEDLNGSDEDNNQLSFNTAKESDSFLHHVNVTAKQSNAIALPFHDYEYPLLMASSSSSNDNALKIVETKEEKMTIVSTEKTAQMPSAAPAQTIGGFGRGRRN